MESASKTAAALTMPQPKLLAIALLALLLGVAQCWPIAETDSRAANVLLLKKSDAPQWEDLGWAWGKKRSAPQPVAAVAPQWDDLGWSWGKRSAQALATEDLIERAQQQLKRRDIQQRQRKQQQQQQQQQQLISGAPRVMRSAAAAVKQTPDWHDLGWAWGRRK